MKKFICINDLQGGTFGVGACGTYIQWRKKAMEWCYMDDHYGLLYNLKTYKIKNSELINFISYYWDIEIVEYNEDTNYNLEEIYELDY